MGVERGRMALSSVWYTDIYLRRAEDRCGEGTKGPFLSVIYW